MGEKFPCLVILSCTGWSKTKVYFKDFEFPYENFTQKQIEAMTVSKKDFAEKVTIKNYNSIKRDWEKEYAESYQYYPSAYGFAKYIAAGAPPMEHGLIEEKYKNLKITNMYLVTNNELVRNDEIK